jgi:hypothetical protein
MADDLTYRVSAILLGFITIELTVVLIFMG